MIKTNTIIDELKELNGPFLENDTNGIKINNQDYLLKKGSMPILLSAPHAVKQYREDKIKKSDYLTGALAIYLAQKCNASYLVRIFNNFEDPNYPIGKTLPSIESHYLKVLKQFLQEQKTFLVVDLHGCSDTKKYDCSLWRDENHPCDRKIIQIFEKNFMSQNLSFDLGSEYLGGQVTRQSAQLTYAFQLEVKRKIRTLTLENQNLYAFLESMEQSLYETYEYALKLEKGQRNLIS